MKVVIVAKTRMGSGSCVGALTFDGRSLRLIAHDRATNDHFNQEYNIGDVWDVRYREEPELIPPHVENIVVTGKKRLPPINDLTRFIEMQMPPCHGGVDALFDGLAQATKAGVQYIAERTGIPPYSTMFWRPDKALVRDDDAKRIRYRYPTADGGRTLTFVGYQEPLPEIPPGTLLRVSLAHWWRPSRMPDGELRCYVQLSGWYLPQEDDAWPPKTDISPFPEPLPEPLQAASAGKAAAWSAPEDLQEAQATLKHVFGFDSFRPLQAEIIANILHKRDTLAIMPTGSGKSLCYQLPALLFPGLTVVVSPLISLMEDQVAQLQQAGVAAAFLNSTLDYTEYLGTTNRIRRGEIDILYAAPETLLRAETLLLLQQVRVDCLTIDEAHCISEWGHDFRPEYRQLVELRRRLADAVCLAVTATATTRVRQDIKGTLHIASADEYVASFDRENLFLAVEPRTNGLAQTVAFLENHRDQAGIIYCATRNQVDELAAQLAARGWPVLPYHAGLENPVRRQHQRRFAYEEGLIIVATIAFGMGIDKSNVRFILHYNLPKNLESYYQQIGRAGRDGLPADCLLLFSAADVRTINYFIRQRDPSQQQGAKRRLGAMLDFCEAGGCRRQPLLAYFGESRSEPSCDTCDNCEAATAQEELGQEQADLTIPAQKFLSCVRRTGQIFGATHIINILRGSRAKSVLSRNHDQLSTYGIGREYSAKEWQLLVQQFLQKGLLTRDRAHGSLKLMERGYQVLKGQKFYGSPVLAAAAQAAHATADVAYDPVLFARLRSKRSELARANDVPPYIIFSDRSLSDMATYFPKSRSAFAAMYGVGEAKLKKYADDFLPIIQNYCEERGIQKKLHSVSHSRSDASIEADPISHIVQLGESREQGNVPELITALKDPNGNVRRLAASALGKLGDGRAVQPLLDLLKNEERPQVRQYAVKALGRIGVAQASETLRQIMQDESEQAYTRKAARRALRQIR